MLYRHFHKAKLKLQVMRRLLTPKVSPPAAKRLGYTLCIKSQMRYPASSEPLRAVLRMPNAWRICVHAALSLHATYYHFRLCSSTIKLAHKALFLLGPACNRDRCYWNYALCLMSSRRQMRSELSSVPNPITCGLLTTETFIWWTPLRAPPTTRLTLARTHGSSSE